MNTRQEGFTIVEVVISMVMLGVILTTLAGLVYASAVQATRSQDISTRTAASLEIVNRYSSLPFASLVTACDTTGTDRARFHRCATVTNNSSTLRTVTVVIKPLQRDTTSEVVTFVRSQRNNVNPLCVGC
ncbi:MAG TPA: prepilin-type N-terminal cleavage/methylation domain-containing protein [Longimicrobiales bacterium]|nr:prepilin-type N-terminal cleavage/methylation domain-containing protein [Longimicrobiales bacterium]